MAEYSQELEKLEHLVMEAQKAGDARSAEAEQQAALVHGLSEGRHDESFEQSGHLMFRLKERMWSEALFIIALLKDISILHETAAPQSAL